MKEVMIIKICKDHEGYIAMFDDQEIVRSSDVDPLAIGVMAAMREKMSVIPPHKMIHMDRVNATIMITCALMIVGLIGISM